MNINEIQIRDPFVLPFNGKYYLYGSTDTDIWKSAGVGFNAYYSDDLVNWSEPVRVFSPPKDYWGTKNFWAPEVHFYNNEFYMLASFIGDGYKRGTAVLKSSSPLGMFLPHSDNAVTPKSQMCLDGTLYIDKQGQPWLVYCYEWVEAIDGEICAVRLSPDLRSSVGEPVTLFKSSSAVWSRPVRSESLNISGYVTDGCFLHRNNKGELFMLWSCFSENGYCQCYAKSDNGEITGIWEHKDIIYDKNGGHGMVFRSYDNKLYLTLHTPNKTPNERAVFIEIEEFN
ncbi:MAG: glycoside hydrolase family 43 protein [Oscillospiraceae bacterium]|nr:glycoside hydrolase family 43 protein [Oscillospiraceae bacterium]